MTPKKNHPTREARSKVKTLEELGAIAEDAQAKGLKIVLAHGVFALRNPKGEKIVVLDHCPFNADDPSGSGAAI